MPDTANADLVARDQAGLSAAALSSDTAGRATAISPGPKRNRSWYRLISPVVVVALWQAASSTGIVPARKLASPASIVHTAYTLVVTNSPTYGTLQESLLVSCERWAAGLAIGAPSPSCSRSSPGSAG